ncbi:alginate O-acetyltransferase AlgF [uncultured Herbaspirillum sp.]|uniref:alginate O-acetyltransferase AlgF n=1 Tax=uncultured Herbaspirillum sp. TaxID=160236 RepID=UPI00261416C4|nr:alginate O-acetyltransferase AlgF [uncultured Herbaspirillum sp.]
MSALRVLAASIALLGCGVAMAADIPLYPTGPAEDAAFIRFINATSEPLQVVARKGQPPLKLEAAKPVSSFFPVQAKSTIKGTLTVGARSLELGVQAKPGEFATVVVLPDAKGIRQVTVQDNPDDFNGLKASLAFFNLDASCSGAALRPAGRTADLFKGVAQGSLQRRSINPVKLAVQLVCGGSNTGPALDLGELKAGERYSVLLLPSASGPRLLAATDKLAN